MRKTLLSLVLITILLLTSCGQSVSSEKSDKTDFADSQTENSEVGQTVSESETVSVSENTTQDKTTQNETSKATTVILSKSATAHQHLFGAWTVLTKAKCGVAGKKVRSCSCGYEETQTVPALKHSWGEWVVITPATYESEGKQKRTCSACGKVEVQTISKKVLTDAEKKAQARVVAQKIADEAVKTGNTDLEKIQYAAAVVSNYCSNATYTTDDKDYSQAYGVFIKGVYTCAGATRALGMVLDCMGYKWTHANENQWTHQWCIVKMDGQEGYADGQVGLAGYGKHPAAG